MLNTPKKIFYILSLLLVLIYPLGVALAQSTTLPADGASDSGAVRAAHIRGYRNQSSDLSQKVNALNTIAVTSLPMPVLFGVGIKNISPNFGEIRPDGHTHEGEDIMAVKGTPIVSPTAAVVLKTEVGVSEGNAVYTANPGGEVFVYMHLDRFGEGVISGTVLQVGSLIGYVGNTGNASGGAAHLHFETHDSSGTPVDPFPRLNQESSFFLLADKMTYLNQILSQSSDSVTLAQLLVANFRSTFTSAAATGIALPNLITNYMASTTASSVEISRTLKVGSRGDDVKALQGSLGLVADGVFGPKTKLAVVTFQTSKGLAADGVFGPASRAALYGSSTLPATSGSLKYPDGCTSAVGYSVTTGTKCVYIF